MPKTEAQKRASKKYYEKNREEIASKRKAIYEKMKTALAMVQKMEENTQIPEPEPEPNDQSLGEN